MFCVLAEIEKHFKYQYFFPILFIFPDTILFIFPDGILFILELDLSFDFQTSVPFDFDLAFALQWVLSVRLGNQR